VPRRSPRNTFDSSASSDSIQRALELAPAAVPVNAPVNAPGASSASSISPQPIAPDVTQVKRPRGRPRTRSDDGAHVRKVADKPVAAGGPILSWPGRTLGSPAISADPHPANAPRLTLEEQCAGGGGAGDGEGIRLVRGDALDVTHALLAEGLEGKVDLVYLDPPFASQADYVLEARLDGPADGRVRRTLAYEDSWATAGRGRRDAGGINAYLDVLAPRLEAMVRLLAPTGSIWVHLDWRAAYLVRVLLDELMGRDAFLNEIVWRRAPNLGRQATSQQFGRTLDTLVVYGGRPHQGIRAKLTPPTRLEPIEPGAIRWDKPEEDGGRPFTTAPRGDYTDASIERLDAEGRVHRTSTGRVYIKYFLVKDAAGTWCRERRVDTLWTDVPPLRHAAASERTGFPTQKPRALLERIVACAAPPGGLVVDLFSGSGTTGEAAHVLGRRAILGDASAPSITTARARLLRAGASLTIERCGEPSLAALACKVHAHVRDDGKAAVRLIAPKEPLAWAIDTAFTAGGPFRVAWHSERSPGARPTPAAEEAIVDVEGDLAVRVFADDGSVGTHVIARADLRDDGDAKERALA
jgi:DNA modification methylase